MVGDGGGATTASLDEAEGDEEDSPRHPLRTLGIVRPRVLDVPVALFVGGVRRAADLLTANFVTRCV